MAETWEQAGYSAHKQCWTEHSMIIVSQGTRNPASAGKNLYSEVPNLIVSQCNYLVTKLASNAPKQPRAFRSREVTQCKRNK